MCRVLELWYEDVSRKNGGAVVNVVICVVNYHQNKNKNEMHIEIQLVLDRFWFLTTVWKFPGVTTTVQVPFFQNVVYCAAQLFPFDAQFRSLVSSRYPLIELWILKKTTLRRFCTF